MESKKPKLQRKKAALEWPFHRFSEPGTRSLKAGEAVQSVTVELFVGEHEGDHRTFGDCRHIKYWMFNTPESGTRTLLAAVLLSAWQLATEMKSTEQSVAELAKVAEENGWTVAKDINSHLRKVNKGGRPVGTYGSKRREIEESFEALTAANPQGSDMSKIAKIAKDRLPLRMQKLLERGEQNDEIDTKLKQVMRDVKSVLERGNKLSPHPPKRKIASKVTS